MHFEIRTLFPLQKKKCVRQLQFVYVSIEQGIMTPGMSYTIAKWAPPQERGIFVFASMGGKVQSNLCQFHRREQNILNNFLFRHIGYRGNMASSRIFNDTFRVELCLLRASNNGVDCGDFVVLLDL